MNQMATPQLLVSSSSPHLIQTPTAIQMQAVHQSQSQNTSIIPSSIMSSMQMPMGTIAIPSGAALQAVAVQAATMAIRQTPLAQAPFQLGSMDQQTMAMSQQIFTQAMIPVSQAATPINFLSSDAKDGIVKSAANVVSSLPQNIMAVQQPTFINTNLAQITQQVQQQAQLQAQQVQQQPQNSAQVVVSQQQVSGSNTSQATTVSTLGLGLMTQEGLLQQPLQTPQFLLAPTSMPVSSMPQLPVTMALDGTVTIPKKKKVPTATLR